MFVYVFGQLLTPRADLVEDQEGTAEGKVFQIDAAALAYLYRREGVPGAYYRPTFIDVEINGELIMNVWTFVVVNKDSVESAPPAWYAEELLRGGQGVLSEGYMQALSRKMGQKHEKAGRLTIVNPAPNVLVEG